MGDIEDYEYLGDGLYARHDGDGVWVVSYDGIRILERIYFEKSTYEALGNIFKNNE